MSDTDKSLVIRRMKEDFRSRCFSDTLNKNMERFLLHEVQCFIKKEDFHNIYQYGIDGPFYDYIDKTVKKLSTNIAEKYSYFDFKNKPTDGSLFTQIGKTLCDVIDSEIISREDSSDFYEKLINDPLTKEDDFDKFLTKMKNIYAESSLVSGEAQNMNKRMFFVLVENSEEVKEILKEVKDEIEESIQKDKAITELVQATVTELQDEEEQPEQGFQPQQVQNENFNPISTNVNSKQFFEDFFNAKSHLQIFSENLQNTKENEDFINKSIDFVDENSGDFVAETDPFLKAHYDPVIFIDEKDEEVKNDEKPEEPETENDDVEAAKLENLLNLLGNEQTYHVRTEGLGNGGETITVALTKSKTESFNNFLQTEGNQKTFFEEVKNLIIPESYTSLKNVDRKNVVKKLSALHVNNPVMIEKLLEKVIAEGMAQLETLNEQAILTNEENREEEIGKAKENVLGLMDDVRRNSNSIVADMNTIGIISELEEQDIDFQKIATFNLITNSIDSVKRLNLSDSELAQVNAVVSVHDLHELKTHFRSIDPMTITEDSPEMKEYQETYNRIVKIENALNKNLNRLTVGQKAHVTGLSRVLAKKDNFEAIKDIYLSSNFQKKFNESLNKLSNPDVSNVGPGKQHKNLNIMLQNVINKINLENMFRTDINFITNVFEKVQKGDIAEINQMISPLGILTENYMRSTLDQKTKKDFVEGINISKADTNLIKYKMRYLYTYKRVLDRLNIIKL